MSSYFALFLILSSHLILLFFSPLPHSNSILHGKDEKSLRDGEKSAMRRTEIYGQGGLRGRETLQWKKKERESFHLVSHLARRCVLAGSALKAR